MDRMIKINSRINKNVVTETKGHSVRDSLKIMRNLKESTGNLANSYDQPNEEQKLLNNFKDINVNIRFIELEVSNDYVFWGGTVDGIIQFIYKVTPEESTSGVEFNYLDDFSPDNPENEDIVNRLRGYYDTFYRYWQDNVIQK